MQLSYHIIYILNNSEEFSQSIIAKWIEIEMGREKFYWLLLYSGKTVSFQSYLYFSVVLMDFLQQDQTISFQEKKRYIVEYITT